MSGSPAVITNPFQRDYTSNPLTDATARTLRAKEVVQNIPVYEQAYQFSVPTQQFNRGWLSSDVPPVAGPTYTPVSSAPDIVYINKSYSRLVYDAAHPLTNSPRQAHQLTAPGIETTYGY